MGLIVMEDKVNYLLSTGLTKFLTLLKKSLFLTSTRDSQSTIIDIPNNFLRAQTLSIYKCVFNWKEVEDYFLDDMK